MTSRGSRRRLLSGNELKERGRREAPLASLERKFGILSRFLNGIERFLALGFNFNAKF